MVQKKNDHYENSIFKSLLIALLGSCLITVAFFLLFLFFRTGTLYTHSLSKKMEPDVRTASMAYASLMGEYEDAIESLASDPDLLDEIRVDWPQQTTSLNQFINKTIRKWSIHPIIHIVSPDRTTAISTGFGVKRYDPNRYSGMVFVLDEGTDTLFHANRFTASNGDQVVMTIARKILDADGSLLGYLYFDLTQAEVQNVFASCEALHNNGQESYIDYIVFNWYNYVLLNQTSLDDIEVKPGSNYLRDSFAGIFKQTTPASINYRSDGTEYLLTGVATPDEKFIVVCSISLNLLQSNNRQMILIFAGLSALLILFCVIFALRINNSIIGPVNDIVRTMVLLGQGDMSARCNFKATNELALVRDQLNQMIVDINQAMRNNEEKQMQLLLAEDNVLKAQIKPHFINNVLESIHWMIRIGDTDLACDALKVLGKMMTERMNYYSSAFERLSDSLDFTKRYIDLQKLCYDDKLCVTYDIDETVLDTLIPTFILQPLVENAIVHGIQPKIGQGTLSIQACRTEGGVRICIGDDGVGIPDEMVNSLLSPNGQKQGIGLYNVHRRLQLSYGDAYGLQIKTGENKGTYIKILIPTL